MLIKKHNRLLHIIRWDIKSESIGINKCKMLHNHLFSVQVEADIRNMWYTYMYLPESQRFSLALLASFVNWTKCWKYDKFEHSIHTCFGFCHISWTWLIQKYFSESYCFRNKSFIQILSIFLGACEVNGSNQHTHSE